MTKIECADCSELFDEGDLFDVDGKNICEDCMDDRENQDEDEEDDEDEDEEAEEDDDLQC